jgi:hypothetical protein
MTARSVYEAAVKAAAATKVATEIMNETVRQTTIDASNTVAGYNLQTGSYANLKAAHVAAAAKALSAGIAAEAARQIAITNARDTLRATGDVGPG